MIEQIKDWDEALFLHLNAFHWDWLDPIMLALTGKVIWFPMYAFFLFLIIHHFKRRSIWILAGVALAILMADQSASGFMKPFFERLRPCHDPRWEGLIHNFSGCGGMYGFVSSHAANSFALATYLAIVFRNRIRGFAWLFLWAALVSYTRIYLGVHYPLDILVGGVVGAVCGWLAWFILVKIQRRYVEESLKKEPS